MNYYERHLGDFAKDTAHLSMLEVGAYDLLLDRYYSTERGIPANEAYKVARARSRAERQAVDAILAEFFQKVDGVWMKNRCEEEIAKANRRISAARENGIKGGRPKDNPPGNSGGTQQEPDGIPDGLSLGSNSQTQTKALQSPDSNPHTPEERNPPLPPLPKSSPPAASPKRLALAEARAAIGLDVDAFDRWIAYRAERKPALKPMSIKAAAEQLAKHGAEQAAVVQQSIANGWQGIFPIRVNGSGSPSEPRKTRYEQLTARR